MGLNYRKPFIKYNEAPENADEILKKKKLMNLDTKILQNTAKKSYNPTINGVRDPNRLIKTIINY